MFAIVTKNRMICYGNDCLKALILLRRGQKWEVLCEPLKDELLCEPNTLELLKLSWYTVRRKGITMDIIEDDFKKWFEVQDG